MIINGINYLLCERRGCEFFADSLRELSDIGNYRLYTEFDSRDGVRIYGDISRWERRDYSQKSHPIIDPVAIHAHLCHDKVDSLGYPGCFGWNPYTKPERLRYNEHDVLEFVNLNANQEYQAIKYVLSFETREPADRNWTPAQLIIEWCKRERIGFHYDYDSLVADVYTGPYKYLCYNLTKNADGTDTVKVYMERV